MGKTRPNLPGDAAADALPAFAAFVLAEARVHALPVGSVQACRDGSFECPWRTCAAHNLIYVTRGRALWTYDNHEQELSPGDLHLVPPGVTHGGQPLTKTLRLISMHAEVLLPDGSDALEHLAPPPLRRIDRGGRLADYFEGYAEEIRQRDKPLAQRFAMPWVRLAFLELIRDDALAGRLAPTEHAPWMTRVMEALGEDLTAVPALDDLADRFGYTPQHLNRRFKGVLGLTPLQFHQRARMQRAAVLLADGAMSVAAVARRVGFEDPYYFSRQFSRVMGQSPSDYRETAARMV